MGFIDSLYITDDKDYLIFEHIIYTSSPTFQYVQSQLASIKRELAANEGVDLNLSTASSEPQVFGVSSNTYSSSVFDTSGGISLDSIVRLDSKWLVAWVKVDGMYLMALGEIPPDYIDVISEDEDEDEDEYEEAGPQQNKENGYQGFSEEDGEPTDEPTLPSATTQIKQTVQISNHTNPFQYFNFFEQFTEIVRTFLNSPKLIASKIENNSHTVMLILQEMIDASAPYITDLNQLRELLPNNSIIRKIISTTKQLQHTATNSINTLAQSSSIMPHSGSSASLHSQSSNGMNGNNINGSESSLLSASIFEKSGNEIPWRKANVKHTQNEMLMDIKERINWILPPSKTSNRQIMNTSSYYNSDFRGSAGYAKKFQPVLASIDGEIEFKSSLSGTPIVELMLNVGNHDLGIPSFHRCVDISRWNNRVGALQFIPPDEKFTLMKYHLNLLDGPNTNVWNFMGLVDLELITGLGIKRNEFEIKLQTKMLNSVKVIEDLKVEIYLPEVSSNDDSGTEVNYSVQTIRMTHGDLEHKAKNSYEWVFDKTMATGLNCTLKASIAVENQDDDDEDNDDGAQRRTIKRPKFIKVSYNNKGSIPSLIKADSLKAIRGLSHGVKPYKGVKYITETGDFILR